MGARERVADAAVAVKVGRGKMVGASGLPSTNLRWVETRDTGLETSGLSH